MKNPLDHIVPDFTIFGAQFTTIWQKLAAGPLQPPPPALSD